MSSSEESPVRHLLLFFVSTQSFISHIKGNHELKYSYCTFIPYVVCESLSSLASGDNWQVTRGSACDSLTNSLCWTFYFIDGSKHAFVTSFAISKAVCGLWKIFKKARKSSKQDLTMLRAH